MPGTRTLSAGCRNRKCPGDAEDEKRLHVGGAGGCMIWAAMATLAVSEEAAVFGKCVMGDVAVT